MSKDLRKLSISFLEAAGFSNEEALKLSPNLTAWVIAAKPKRLPDLPDRPVRDYKPFEGIINYIRADDGLGPWLNAGVLTRPFIRNSAPNAYIALNNWLRGNTLPDDIKIPTLSESLDNASSPVTLREARRLARRGDRSAEIS